MTKQSMFRSTVFGQSSIDEIFDDQITNLSSLECLLRLDKEDGVREGIEKLDINFIRYSVIMMRYQMRLAAREDCAALIADSVLDFSTDDISDKWEQWLAAAPCWSQFARYEWAEAADAAVSIVVTRLKEAGVLLAKDEARKLESAVSSLKIDDVLPPELMARFFLAQS